MSKILSLIKCIVDKRGYYSSMQIDPMLYHLYRENIQNLTDVIEEIDVEITINPVNLNKLLDFRASLSKRLEILQIEKIKNTPAIAG